MTLLYLFWEPENCGEFKEFKPGSPVLRKDAVLVLLILFVFPNGTHTTGAASRLRHPEPPEVGNRELMPQAHAAGNLEQDTPPARQGAGDLGEDTRGPETLECSLRCVAAETDRLLDFEQNIVDHPRRHPHGNGIVTGFQCLPVGAADHVNPGS